MTINEIGIIVAMVLSIFGAVFGIFNYFKKPQENIDIKQAQLESDFKGKYEILKEHLEWEKDMNNDRFGVLNENYNKLLRLNQNHTHTIDVKVDALKNEIALMRTEFSSKICTLSTIIEERIPKKP